MGLDLTLSTYALIGGSVVTSNVLFSNISTTAVGVVPLLNGRFGPIDIRVKDKVDIWTQFFKKASVSIQLTGVHGGLVSIWFDEHRQERPTNHAATFLAPTPLSNWLDSSLTAPSPHL